MVGAVWLQMQPWVTDHPVWTSAALHLPEGSTPFGTLSKAAGGLGLFALALGVLRPKSARPATASDAYQDVDIPQEDRVQTYGSSNSSTLIRVMPRRVTDFHAKVSEQAPRWEQPSDSAKGSAKSLVFASLLGLVVALAVFSQPLMAGFEAKGIEVPDFASLVDTVPGPIASFGAFLSGQIAAFDYDAFVKEGRAIVQAATNGQQDAQILLGVYAAFVVWIAITTRAMIKLLTGRGRRRARARQRLA